MTEFTVRPIGTVSSPLRGRDEAPKQGDEGAPDAWIAFTPAAADGLRDLRVGTEVLGAEPGPGPGPAAARRVALDCHI